MESAKAGSQLGSKPIIRKQLGSAQGHGLNSELRRPNSKSKANQMQVLPPEENATFQGALGSNYNGQLPS